MKNEFNEQTKNISLRQNKNAKKEIIWNTNKKDGWTNYKSATDRNEDLDALFNDKTIDIDSEVENFERVNNNIKNKVFGKVKFKKRINIARQKLDLQKINQ